MSAQPLAKSFAADGKTEIVRIAGKPLLVSAVEFNRLHALNAELLEACTHLAEGIEACGIPGVFLNQAHAAIAKAKGEEA